MSLAESMASILEAELRDALDKSVQASIEKLLDRYSVPLVSYKQFAKAAGVSDSVVYAWITRGYLPSVKVGKRLMINLAKLSDICRNSNWNDSFSPQFDSNSDSKAK